MKLLTDAFGFRAYLNVETPLEEQSVAVWNAQIRVEGMIVGSELGPLQTSALGAVAMDVLSRPEASRLGLTARPAASDEQRQACHSGRMGMSSPARQ
ncbi:hypothetical protein EHF33_11600 [Deinococcus psychrotolerans]|uniref:Uncharacterized protein n=1 Tax=Deinococcus psychrotolerans TaxID=2489213 RepID=A0A3G8YGJ3_9DEIO|nr:hypothetical protein [Deinococcus psychrotolerans]AZI43307.1 hypothetical protein EHF33_11600 [Deinococcus psychrotolerans]